MKNNFLLLLIVFAATAAGYLLNTVVNLNDIYDQNSRLVEIKTVNTNVRVFKFTVGTDTIIGCSIKDLK